MRSGFRALKKRAKSGVLVALKGMCGLQPRFVFAREIVLGMAVVSEHTAIWICFKHFTCFSVLMKIFLEVYSSFRSLPLFIACGLDGGKAHRYTKMMIRD